jgi:hypothetical protein
MNGSESFLHAQTSPPPENFSLALRSSIQNYTRHYYIGQFCDSRCWRSKQLCGLEHLMPVMRCSRRRDLWFIAGVFNPYLLKGHILMAERFAGRIQVLQSKICILLQDMRTNISLRKHTYDSFVILLMFYNLFLLLLFSYSAYPANIPYLQYLLRH